MRILELSNKECFEVLTHLTLGRLACSLNHQPYIVPFYFAYHQRHLYSFATHGQKIDWMRQNQLVCVEVDEIVDRDNSVSVIIKGRFEELLDSPEWKSERELAHELLQHEAMWWEPAYVKTSHEGVPDDLIPVYYRIHIDQLSGRRAQPDQPVASVLLVSSEEIKGRKPASAAPRKSWLKGLLHR